MKVLFFTPNSAIWQHTFPEALAAEALKQGGHEIVYITCGGMFKNICISMRSQGIALDSPLALKQQVCKRCTENKELIKDRFGFNGFDIAEYLSEEEVAFIEKEITKISPDNYYGYHYKNVPLGRLATYETMLQFKKNDLSMNESKEWQSYVAWFRNAFYVACAAPKILDSIKPDRVIIYSNSYSSNNVFNFCAKQKDIASYSMTAWDNYAAFYQGFIMVRGYNLDHWYGQFSSWHRIKHLAFPENMLRKAVPHILSQIQAKTFLTYSKGKENGKNILEYFNILSSQKIAVATMSSYDEIIASYAIKELDTIEGKIFANQLEWIKGLITFFKNRPDLFLIIRVHPREFPNHREKQKSKNALLYESALSELPDNVRVNWPSDNLSIYDIAEYTDLILNGFSSSGLEMSLLGIPVLSYANEWNTYPIDLDIEVETKEEYFAAIDKGIESGWSFERIRLAYRWLAFKYSLTTFDVSDGFSMQPGEATRKFADIYDKPASIKAQKEICRFIESGIANYADLIDKKVFAESSYDEEYIIIKQMLQEVYSTLYSNKIQLYLNTKKFVNATKRDIRNGVFRKKGIARRLSSNLKALGKDTLKEIRGMISAKNGTKDKLYSKLTKFLKEEAC